VKFGQREIGGPIRQGIWIRFYKKNNPNGAGLNFDCSLNYRRVKTPGEVANLATGMCPPAGG
jgi:hypothetical protein